MQTGLLFLAFGTKRQRAVYERKGLAVVSNVGDYLNSKGK